MRLAGRKMTKAGRSLFALLVGLGLAAGGATTGVLLAHHPAQKAQSHFYTQTAPNRPLQTLRASVKPVLSRGAPSSGGKAAPDFHVRTIDGRRLTLADVRGQPTVLFSMDSYGCESCVIEAQALESVYERFAHAGLQVIAFDIDPASSQDSLRGFIEQAGNLRYTVASDDHARTALAYRISELDTIILIDPQARIAYRAIDPTADELGRAISKVVT